MSILAPDNALLKKAEVEAEQVVSLLRIAVAIGLLLAFFLAVKGSNVSPENYLRRQWVFAVATMISYLLVVRPDPHWFWEGLLRTMLLLDICMLLGFGFRHPQQ